MAGVYRIYPKQRRNFFGNLSATKLLIFANVIFFIIAIILVQFTPNFFNYIALNPTNIFQGKYLWTFLTSMFMHAPGVIPFLSFHLLINMFVLFSLGGMMEKIIGKKRFLWFYLISGLIAGFLFVFLSYFFGNTDLGARIFSSPAISAIGASGAIFAIAGLFMILTPRLKFMIIFLPFFSLPAYLMIPLVLFGTWLVSSSTGFPIGNTAHLGGFLCGIIFGLYLRKKYPRKTQMLSRHFSM
ncbi:hypothetical protein ES703_41614 [subsurface metagenome]